MFVFGTFLFDGFGKPKGNQSFRGATTEQNDKVVYQGPLCSALRREELPLAPVLIHILYCVATYIPILEMV